MIKALFIADLHLEQGNEIVTETFEQFLKQVAVNAKKLYILGDFFNFWIGDDVMTDWHRQIAAKLSDLSHQGIEIFLMVGNRDFLLGRQFSRLANCQLLADPTVIQLDKVRVVLKHGDDLCTLDKSHQLFRKVTRLPLIKFLFLAFPKRLRLAIARYLRRVSYQSNKEKSEAIMDVVHEAVVACLEKTQTEALIHGHTHTPQVHHFKIKNSVKTRYVLGDWSDRCQYLCYDSTKGLIIKQFCRED